MGSLSILMGVPASLMSADDEVIIKPVLSEDIGESASVSNHAVEDATQVADHVEAGNRKLSISTIITRDMGLIGSAIFGADKTPEDKIITLEEWLNSGTLLRYSGPVFKGIGVFKQGIDITISNLVLTGLSFKRDSNSGGGFSVSMSLEEVRIAYAREVTVNLPVAAKPPAKKGPTEVSSSSTSSAKEKDESMLHAMIYR